MIRALLFYRSFWKKQFAYALAHHSDFPHVDNPYTQYACYRLGMYQTVANTAFYCGSNWRGGFARAVSLAACGRFDEAEKQADAWLKNTTDEKLKSTLADCLAPFHSQLAHKVLQTTGAPVALRAAIYMQVGENKLAENLLADQLAINPKPKNPENYLYYSNSTRSENPFDQLEHLNRFLKGNRVPDLRLIDDSHPPSPVNIQSNVLEAANTGPLVSILMTAYNSEERIASSISSILKQSYQNIELIVIDDASTDNTSAIIQTIAEKDQRVKYLQLHHNVGTYVAKNIGMQHAKGEFATCHDSDDWAHPCKISRQVQPLLKDKSLVFTTSHWVRMQDDGIYYARPVHPLTRINPASPLFRRELVLKHAGVWDPVRTGADSEFLNRLKLVFGSRAMHRIAQPLTLGSHRSNSLMTADDTGYSTEGASPTRLAYWESWNHWQLAELRANRKPYMGSFQQAERHFDAPDSIHVPPEDIDACIRDLNRHAQ